MDENRDATRRTRLATERTYLAWWRSGLTALAVSLGAGRLVPELAGGARWPYEAVGAGYAVLGVGFVVCAELRRRAIERALDAGAYAQLGGRLAIALTAAGVLLGAATIAIVVSGG